MKMKSNMKPTDDQIEQVLYLYKTGNARNFLDACSKVCTGELNYRALVIAAAGEFDVRNNTTYMLRSVCG